MSNRNRMPGLRLKGGIWQIEKRCKHAEGGWLRESTGTSSRTEAEDVLIRRLAELKDIAERKAQRVFTFEEAALRYLEDIAHKPSAGTAAFHIDQVLPFIGDKVLAQVHDGTVKPFVDHELARGAAPGASLADGLIVAGLSFVAAWAAIALLMRFVDAVGFLPFVIYRLILAGLLFWWAL